MADQKFDEKYSCLINHDVPKTFLNVPKFENRGSDIPGIRRSFSFIEDFCDIPREELERMIDELSKIGYPNPVSKEELEYALRGNYL